MARRHPGSRRTHKARHDEAEDAFVAGTLEFSQWAKQNQRLLIFTGVVLAAILWGVFQYTDYRGNLEAQASAELEAIHQTIQFGDREAAKEELGVFLTRFGETDLAGEARLLLGEQYLRTGEPSQAISTLEPATESLRTPLSIQAGFLLAAAYEEESRWGDAEALYLRLADRAELPFQIRDALESAARIRSAQGNHAAAADLYRRILDTFEEDEPARGYYEMRLAETETAAQAASPAEQGSQ